MWYSIQGHRIYEVFPLLCPKCGGQIDDGVHIEPNWDQAPQAAPDFEVDQCINWLRARRGFLPRVSIRRPLRHYLLYSPRISTF